MAKSKRDLNEDEKVFRLNINIPSWLNDELQTRSQHLSMSRNSYINMILAKYINDEKMIEQAKLNLASPTSMAQIMASIQNKEGK